MENQEPEQENPGSPSEPTGPSDSSESIPTESPNPSFDCPYCTRANFATERYLNIHIARKHKDQPQIHYEDRPVREPPTGPRVEVHMPPPVDLEKLEAVTAENIEALGQLLHMALKTAKVQKAMHPNSRLPALDTHFAFALQLRARATAHLAVQYAAKNETFMRLLLAFNRAFEGSESATVLISLGLGLAGTIGAPAPPMLHGMFNADVMQAVEAENRELLQQFAEIRRQQEAARSAQETAA